MGITPPEFWNTTPRELARVFAGFNERARREEYARQSQALTVARFRLMDPKKLPTFKQLYRQIMNPPRLAEQTPEQGVMIAEHLNAMFGGKDLRTR